MTKISVRGYEINTVESKDSFDRRAVQYRNNIIATLKKIDITEKDINIEILPFAFKKSPAKAEWQIDGKNMAFEYESAGKFVDNLYIVQKIIELEVNSVVSEKKSKSDFIKDFLKKEDSEQENSNQANSKKHSENLSDRNKFAKMNPSAKLNPKDQE